MYCTYPLLNLSAKSLSDIETIGVVVNSMFEWRKKQKMRQIISHKNNNLTIDSYTPYLGQAMFLRLNYLNVDNPTSPYVCCICNYMQPSQSLT